MFSFLLCSLFEISIFTCPLALFDMLFAKAATLLAVAGVTCQANSVTDAERYSINNVKSINFGTTLGSACACGVLATFFRNNIHFPGAPAYKNETTYYWDLKEALSPRCIFVPSTTHDVAKGIVILNACKSQFAVRGGGHMPVSLFYNGCIVLLTDLDQRSSQHGWWRTSCFDQFQKQCDL